MLRIIILLVFTVQSYGVPSHNPPPTSLHYIHTFNIQYINHENQLSRHYLHISNTSKFLPCFSYDFPCRSVWCVVVSSLLVASYTVRMEEYKKLCICAQEGSTGGGEGGMVANTHCSAYATSHSQIENILLVKTGILCFHNIGFQFQTHTLPNLNDQ